jgi:hypothetical protein
MEFGIAAAAVDGQGESGDTHVVQYEQDSVLVAAIDGIGHGASAAAAALAASSVLKSHAAETLETVVQMCHDELRSTRGAVMSLASISPRLGQMRWLGVGNVQGVVQRAGAAKGSGQEVLLLRAGLWVRKCRPFRPPRFLFTPATPSFLQRTECRVNL